MMQLSFKNEQDRQSHPFASLIPLHLWNNDFASNFDTTYIPLMQEHDITTLKNTLSGFFDENENDRYRIWLATAVSHSQFAFETLYEFGKDLELDETEMLVLAFKWGNKDYILHLMQKYQDNPLDSLPYKIKTLLFSEAARHGHLFLLEYLEEMFPNDLKTMIEFDDNISFSLACENGHVHILEYLIGKAPELLATMLVAEKDYESYTHAAANGHIEVLEYLESKATPIQFQGMIASIEYVELAAAAANGHIEVLEYLKRKCPDQVEAILIASTFKIFNKAIMDNNQSVVDHFLSYLSVFKYVIKLAPRRMTPYKELAYAATIKQLSCLKQGFEEKSPNASFNITRQDDEFLLYMIYFILFKPTEFQNDIMMLLSIPSIRNIAHQNMFETPNLLLRTALIINNQEVVRALLTIPAVHQLAVANQYYRADKQDRTDLRTLAADNQSSHRRLSASEERRLNELKSKYQPELDNLGIERCIALLREDLKKRLEAHPVYIWTSIRDETESPEKKILPVTWEDFQSLHLAEDQYQDALKAYYKNKYHTAWRFLLKPNPWIHQDAVFVNQNEQGKWSSFDMYQPLICLLYLAARDVQIPATDNYTITKRVVEFFKQLAAINRGHNWDKIRAKIDRDKKPMLDKDGRAITEQFDDEEGDRPTCYPATLRPLMESLRGHPLTSFLTEETVRSELQQFVRSYFKKIIHEKGNGDLIKAARDKYIDGDILDEEELQLFKEINLSKTEQDCLMNNLIEKYGTQFSEDFQFVEIIKEAFKLEYHSSHFFKFDHMNLKQFLEPEPQSSVVTLGLFAQQGECKSERQEHPSNAIKRGFNQD